MNIIKMNRTKIIIILLGIFVIVSSSIAVYFFLQNYMMRVYNNAYYQGITDAQLSINNNILSQINQNGYVVMNILSGNQTVQLKLVPSK